MTDRLTIELDDAGLLARLNAAIASLEHPGKLMDAIGGVLEGATAVRLDKTKADPAGLPWAPAKPATLARLKAQYKGSVPGSLLVRAARGMRAGLTHNLVGEHAVEVGFDKPYAIYHEFGTKKMPRRGLLTADPEQGTLGAHDRDDVLDVVEKFLQEML